MSMQPDDYAYDVFISYSSIDQGWVRSYLLPRLERAGLKVLLDHRDFEIGVPRLVNVERAIQRSRKVLAIFQPTAAASGPS